MAELEHAAPLKLLSRSSRWNRIIGRETFGGRHPPPTPSTTNHSHHRQRRRGVHEIPSVPKGCVRRFHWDRSRTRIRGPREGVGERGRLAKTYAGTRTDRLRNRSEQKYFCVTSRCHANRSYVPEQTARFDVLFSSRLYRVGRFSRRDRCVYHMYVTYTFRRWMAFSEARIFPVRVENPCKLRS